MRKSGKVIAVGRNIDGRCEVHGWRWRNMDAIFCGHIQTVGLKKDGKLIATGNNEDGFCNVSRWRNIVSLSFGRSHVVGLRKDGTVIAMEAMEAL